MRRLLPAALLAACLASAAALAHLLPGVSRMRPGSPFNWYAVQAVSPLDGGYGEAPLEFEPLRGRALAFLVIDPYLPGDLAEARRFERLAHGLRHTAALLVAAPSRSQDAKALAAQATHERLTLPLVVDRRDVFPYAFGFGRADSPRYELFDRSWTLLVQNGRALRERLAEGVTLAEALRALDRGDRIVPQTVP